MTINSSTKQKWIKAETRVLKSTDPEVIEHGRIIYELTHEEIERQARDVKMFPVSY